MTRTSALVLLLSMSMPRLAHSQQNLQQPAAVHLDEAGEKWARESLQKMSLEQKVGQMFMVWSLARLMNVESPDYLKLRDTVRTYHLGGLGLTVRFEDGILYENEPLEAAMVTNQLQKDAEFPLLFGADFEHGLGMRLKEVTNFPQPMAFGATGNVELARQAGRITAQEARAIGVHWNWYPVADVNSNPLNPIINTRSFGEDPKLVSDMVAAYIEGAHEYGLLTTAKHFPGHGDTDTDSHTATPIVDRDKAYFDDVALPPFRAAIAAGVDAVMVAHILAPALDPNPKHIATLSPAIVTGLLKQQLGFTGLVVTDAFDMGGLTLMFPEGGPAAAARAAVKAVQAGNDMLLIPSDLDASYHGLLQAVRSGEITEARIDESVLKILRAKASVGLDRTAMVDLDAATRIVDKPSSLAMAQEIADQAVTLVRDNHRVLPLKATHAGTNPARNPYLSAAETHNRIVVLVFTDDSRSDSGRLLDQQVKMRIPDANVMYIDPRTAVGMTPPVLDAVQQAQAVIAAIYMAPVPGKVVRDQSDAVMNAMALQDAAAALLQSVLRAANEKTAVIAMGNPYLAAAFPGIQTFVCTYSHAQVSEMSAVKAMFGEIPMPGRLPVTIPNFAKRGAGLGAPAPVSSGGTQ